MGVETQLGSVAENARNPGGPFNVTVHDSSFPVEGLTRDEADLFERQLNDLVGDFDSSVLLEILQQRQEIIGLTAAFAKQIFDERTFAGIDAGDNEIGFSILRPGHINQDSTGTIQNNWYFQPGTTGWVDWIGNGGANNYTVTEDQVVLVLAFLDQEKGASEVSGLNVDEFGRNMDLLPQDENNIKLQDNDRELQVRSLPTLIGQENDQIHIRLRYDRDVETQPRLFGFTYGLGTFLNTEDY